MATWTSSCGGTELFGTELFSSNLAQSDRPVCAKRRTLDWKKTLRGVSVVSVILLAVLVTAGSSPVRAQGATPSIELSGYAYAADNFVFCIDRSCSMGWQGDLNAVKSALSETLQQLPPSASFSLVAFSTDTITFSPGLLPADSANVFNATAWLNALGADGATCMAEGVIQALAIAEFGVGSSTVILIADGTPNCQSAAETITAITAANLNQIPVHSVVVPGQGANTTVISFLEDLAFANGGTFANMAIPPPDPFVRGDANGDGAVNVPDVGLMLAAGFSSATAPICEKAADVNADGTFMAIADSIYLLSYMFLESIDEVAAPFPSCGAVGASLGCEISNCP